MFGTVRLSSWSMLTQIGMCLLWLPWVFCFKFKWPRLYSSVISIVPNLVQVLGFVVHTHVRVVYSESPVTYCFWFLQVLYVMELMQNQEEGKAYFSSISEFLLTHPVLSFGIQAVSRCRLRHTEVLPAEEENDNLSVGRWQREFGCCEIRISFLAGSGFLMKG